MIKELLLHQFLMTYSMIKCSTVQQVPRTAAVLHLSVTVPRHPPQQQLQHLQHHFQELIFHRSLKKKKLRKQNKMKKGLSAQDFAKTFKEIIPPTIFLGA